MGNMYKKKNGCFISQQINANQIHYEVLFQPIRVTKMKKTDSTKCWRGCGATGPLITLVRM